MREEDHYHEADITRENRRLASIKLKIKKTKGKVSLDGSSKLTRIYYGTIFLGIIDLVAHEIEWLGFPKLSWGLQTPPLCLLCNLENESRNHLYFLCPYSSHVWSFFSSRLGIASPSASWDDTSRSILSLLGSRHRKYLTILVWQASIYVIWWERNDRLHRGNHRSPDLTVSKISSIIKNRISAIRPENNIFASELIQLWFSMFP
ncbi:hypothetical protein Rs2_04090 [Raphanus sativus]|nr:hypothetical protein Rs2_04090 [Raphanus sativus]